MEITNEALEIILKKMQELGYLILTPQEVKKIKTELETIIKLTGEK